MKPAATLAVKLPVSLQRRLTVKLAATLAMKVAVDARCAHYARSYPAAMLRGSRAAFRGQGVRCSYQEPLLPLVSRVEWFSLYVDAAC